MPMSRRLSNQPLYQRLCAKVFELKALAQRIARRVYSPDDLWGKVNVVSQMSPETVQRMSSDYHEVMEMLSAVRQSSSMGYAYFAYLHSDLSPQVSSFVWQSLSQGERKLYQEVARMAKRGSHCYEVVREQGMAYE
ncbi:MAG: hypothetical protein ACYCOU_05190 [Sulfobacillus sp.]